MHIEGVVSLPIQVGFKWKLRVDVDLYAWSLLLKVTQHAA